MSVSKDEAQSALHDVETAERRSQTLFLYGLASPYFMLWGALWIVAGAVGALSPANAGFGWSAVDVIGLLGSAYLVVRYARRSAIATTAFACSATSGRSLCWRRLSG